MSLNLFGLDDGFDVALACLNVIKGELADCSDLERYILNALVILQERICPLICAQSLKEIRAASSISPSLQG